jgi:beta-galactosidase
MPVRVYGNESPVELFVNGRSLGSKTVHNTTAVWHVEFVSGQNVLSARSASREDEAAIHYEHRSTLFTENLPTPVILAVNAGAGEQFIDRNDRVWEADRAYTEGSWGHVDGTGERSHQRILDTDDDPLYQTRRLGSHSYRFDVPDGSYLVGLHLAKLADTSPETGKFHVDLNGLALEVSDLVPFTRREIELPVTASGDRGLIIRLVSESGDAFVNGIVVQRTGGSPASRAGNQ